MNDPRLPRLPDPATSARVTMSGRQDRGRPIFHAGAGSTEDFTFWEVEVTPLVATSVTGRDLNPAHPDAPGVVDRAVFEVRAVFYGEGHEVFGRQPNTRRVEETQTEDPQLARAIATAATEILRPGGRRLVMVDLARDIERRRT